MKRFTTFTAAVAAIFALSSGAQAQAWDAPSFLAPNPGEDVGIYLVDPGVGDLGIQGIWRGSAKLSVRGGFIDAGGTSIVQLGVETWGDIDVGNDFPLEVAWTAGAGASLNGSAVVSLPIGLTIGKSFDLGSLPIKPYAHPRVSTSFFTNPVTDDLEVDLDIPVDIGADFMLGNNLTARLGVSFGNGDAIGVGIAWRQ